MMVRFNEICFVFEKILKLLTYLYLLCYLDFYFAIEKYKSI